MKIRHALVAFVFAVAAISACGAGAGSGDGGGTGGGGGSSTDPCTTTWQTLCEKGAACKADGGGYAFVLNNGVLFSSNSSSTCATHFALQCEERDGGMPACVAGAQNAQCGTTSLGSGVVLPTGCDL